MKSKKIDPDDWFAELEMLNEQLEEIDVDFMKSEKELAAHILQNLPKGYNTVKKFIKMGDNYLNDLEKVQKQVSKHWKSNFRKKSSKYETSDDSSNDSSDDDSSRDERKGKGKKDKLALQVTEEKKDRRNQYGILICGHCNKPGHGMANCWELHGRPAHVYTGNNDTTHNLMNI